MHVRDKIISVECGTGTQSIRWLANVGVARYDDSFGKSLGPPVGVQREGGTMCANDDRVVDVLGPDQHCFVLLSDFAAE